MSSQKLEILPAKPADVPLLVRFIAELNEAQKLKTATLVTEEDLHAALFAERPHVEAVIGCLGEEAVGYAMYYGTFSSSTGKPGLHLEDLMVRPQYRGKGFGKDLMDYVAQTARDRGCKRLEWWVLEWNTKAQEFYKSIGAEHMDYIQIFRTLPNDPPGNQP